MNTSRFVRSPASSLLLLLFAVSVVTATGCGKIMGVHPPGDTEDCANGRDDDADGRIDCLDSICAGRCLEGAGNAWERAARGQRTIVESCTDGIDDDGDGLLDAADPGCWGAEPPTTYSCTSGTGLLRTWAGEVSSVAIRPLGPDGRTDPYVAGDAGTIGGGVSDAPISGRLEALELDTLSFLDGGETATLALRPIAASGGADVNIEPRVAVVLDGVRGAVELRLGNRVVGTPYAAFGWHQISLRTEGTDFVLRVQSREPDAAPPIELRLDIGDAALPPSALHVVATGAASRRRSGFDDIRLRVASEHPCGQIVPLSGWSATSACGDPYVDRGPLREAATPQRMLLSAASLPTSSSVTTCVTASGPVTNRAWAMTLGQGSRFSTDWTTDGMLAVAATERSNVPSFVFASIDATARTIRVDARTTCEVSPTAASDAQVTANLDDAIPVDETPIAISFVADDALAGGEQGCVPTGSLSLYLVTEPRYGTGGAMQRKLYRAEVDRESLLITVAPTPLPFPLDTAGLPTFAGLACGERVLAFPSSAAGQRAARFYTIETATLHGGSGDWTALTFLGAPGVGQSGNPYELVLTSSGVGSFDLGRIDSVVPTIDSLGSTAEDRSSRLAWFYGSNENVGLAMTGAPSATLTTSNLKAACNEGRTDGGGSACFSCAVGTDVSCVDADVVDAARLVPNPTAVLPSPRDALGDGSIVEIVPGSGATWVIPSRTDEFTMEMDLEGDASIELGSVELADVSEFGTKDRIELRMDRGTQRIQLVTRALGSAEGRDGTFPREPGWIHVQIVRRRDGFGALVLDAVVTARGSGCELARLEGLPDRGVPVSRVSVLAVSSVPGGGIPTFVEGFSLRGAGAGSATDCGGSLVDTNVDPANCGICGNVCPITVACVAGTCNCPSGSQICGDACVDVLSSRDHCGMCGMACAFGSVCSGGSCSAVAGSGETCDSPRFLLEPGPWSTTFDFSASADDDPTIPRSFNGASREGVFAWRAPSDGYLTVAIESASCASEQTRFDTVLEIYDGGCAGTQVGVDDDSGNCAGSRAVVDVIAGHDYTIVVSTYDPFVAPDTIAFDASFVPRGTGNGTCGAPLQPLPTSGAYAYFEGSYDAGTFTSSSTASSCSLLSTTNAVYLDPRYVVAAVDPAAPIGTHLWLDVWAQPTYLPVQVVASVFDAPGGCGTASEIACSQSALLNDPIQVPRLRTRLGSLPLVALGAVDSQGAPATGLVSIALQASMHYFEDCFGSARSGFVFPVATGSDAQIWPSNYAAAEQLDVDADWSACSGFQPGQDAFFRISAQSGGTLTVSATPAQGGAAVPLAARLFDVGATTPTTLGCGDVPGVAQTCELGAPTASFVLSQPTELLVAVALPTTETSKFSDLTITLTLAP